MNSFDLRVRYRSSSMAEFRGDFTEPLRRRPVAADRATHGRHHREHPAWPSWAEHYFGLAAEYAERNFCASFGENKPIAVAPSITALVAADRGHGTRLWRTRAYAGHARAVMVGSSMSVRQETSELWADAIATGPDLDGGCRFSLAFVGARFMRCVEAPAQSQLFAL